MNVDMASAVVKAKQFLTEQAGLSTFFLTLDKIEQKDDKWTVVFEYVLLTPRPKYEVDIDENGSIVGYRHT